MKNFSFRRYGMLLRLDFVGEWRKNLIRLSGLFLACFAIMLVKIFFHSWTYGSYPFRANDSQVSSTVLGLTIVLWAFYLIKGASTLMQHVRTKPQMIAHFTLPATTGEKFAARLSFLLLEQTAGFAAAFLLADLTQGLVFFMMRDVPMFFTPFAFEALADLFSAADASELAILALGILSTHAVYTLGATVFRRWPFVLTVLCNWVLGIVFITAVITFAAKAEANEALIRHYLDTYDVEATARLVLFIWSLTVTVAGYSLAYVLYRRRQLS